MSEDTQYAVYLHPGALEALGEAIKPFLSDVPGGPYILCHELDTGGSLCEMLVRSQASDGSTREMEVMIPISMIRLVVSVGAISDPFGFTGAD